MFAAEGMFLAQFEETEESIALLKMMVNPLYGNKAQHDSTQPMGFCYRDLTIEHNKPIIEVKKWYIDVDQYEKRRNELWRAYYGKSLPTKVEFALDTRMMLPFPSVFMGARKGGLVQTQFATASSTTYSLPADWNNADNIMHAIGGGGDARYESTTGGWAGGGGAYSSSSNKTFTGGTGLTLTVGTNMIVGGSTNAGNTVILRSSNSQVLIRAKGGQSPSSSWTTSDYAQQAQGGSAFTGGVGDTLYDGGTGAATDTVFGLGGGGGGAGGPLGSGAVGTTHSAGVGTDGVGGAGLDGTTASTPAGSAGSDGSFFLYNGNFYFGSGAGGGPSRTAPGSGSPGRDGGLYGGGGGAPSFDNTTTGKGKGGCIIIINNPSLT